MRDLYEILGVPKTATEDDIKRAYRKKARELHPDAGGDEDGFKELTTAYEILKNPEARSNYDRFGDPRGPGGAAGMGDMGGFGDLSDLIDAFFGGQSAGFGRRRSGPEGGRDAVLDVVIDLAEAATGVRRDVEVSVLRGCDTCDSTGAAPGGSGPTTCRTCQGAGMVQRVQRSMFGQVMTATACPDCAGSGQIVSDPCNDCGGEGRRHVTETLTIDIPEGVDDGTRLRMSDRGEAGRRGGPSGDLYVRIHLEEHPVFQRAGNDLHTELTIPMTQAALGHTLELDGLHGPVEIDIPPGTQSGTVRTLRRQGMPKLGGGGARGDLHVHVRVEIPTHLDEEQRDLLRQLADTRGEVVTERSRGFLGRLREAFG